MRRRDFLASAAATLLAGTAALRPARAEEDLTPLPGAVAAPAFALPGLDKHAHRLSDFRGRPVVVNFWALWCGPCRRELPSLATLHRQIAPHGVAVLAVNLGGDRPRVLEFLDQTPCPGLPILLDETSALAGPYHVSGLPLTYVIDPKGIIRLGALGARDWSAPAITRQLLALRAAP
jgi:thiol-disulfide isomerase/thioredoxin